MTRTAVPEQHPSLPVDDLVLEGLFTIGCVADIPIVKIVGYLPQFFDVLACLFLSEEIALHLVLEQDGLFLVGPVRAVGVCNEQFNQLLWSQQGQRRAVSQSAGLNFAEIGE